jgi:hypothetical protein
MAVWQLRTKHKKSAETHTFMNKDGVRINVIEGFRWGKVLLTTEGDTAPAIDLSNPHGLNTFEIPDTEWDLDSFDDGWYSDIQVIEGELPDEELEELLELFSGGGIYDLEDHGWEDESECEWWFYGPLELEKIDD